MNRVPLALSLSVPPFNTRLSALSGHRSPIPRLSNILQRHCRPKNMSKKSGRARARKEGSPEISLGSIAIGMKGCNEGAQRGQTAKTIIGLILRRIWFLLMLKIVNYVVIKVTACLLVQLT